MDAALEGDELIDVVVRLPRKAVENTLLSAVSSNKEIGSCRLGEAKALLTGRLKLAACFTGVRFSDPSFDMILQLYVATQEGRHITVSQLSSLSGGSSTTALRHIEHLEALGYISREADRDDRRRANVAMLPPLSTAVDQWLDLQMAASRLGC
ncbi:MarR family transcriptional regulator [Rhizorhapis suberifaciens]|uniref:HTH marR-type domain-containing protein n=1 Tax=Rhizorhapis suberifaciens TaxID=13656 RepID=A0A840HZ75_9SPHN|nr:MarR family transcriptional regulator [Rhizorhapis suberifaciens]MBB4642724.1 hypothetical protein [Rhizorhapis suberifaciens]